MIWSINLVCSQCTYQVEYGNCRLFGYVHSAFIRSNIHIVLVDVWVCAQCTYQIE